PAAGYRMRSFAIGDCCLFHVRQGELLRTFPMEGSAAFGLDPAVVGSIDRKQDHLLEFQAIDGQCLPGDLVVLATDAIALWAMNRLEAGEPVSWDPYWDMPEEAWREEIFALRNATRMRFDDSTLVLLRVIEETAAPAPPAVEVGEPSVDDSSAEPIAAAEDRATEAIPVEEPVAEAVVAELPPTEPLKEPEPAEASTAPEESPPDVPSEPKEP
ncbi:MAG: hypothetical protein ACYC35_22770, partial [Pirellulales bacterium]